MKRGKCALHFVKALYSVFWLHGSSGEEFIFKLLVQKIDLQPLSQVQPYSTTTSHQIFKITTRPWQREQISHRRSPPDCLITQSYIIYTLQWIYVDFIKKLFLFLKLASHQDTLCLQNFILIPFCKSFWNIRHSQLLLPEHKISSLVIFPLAHHQVDLWFC